MLKKRMFHRPLWVKAASHQFSSPGAAFGQKQPFKPLEVRVSEVLLIANN